MHYKQCDIATMYKSYRSEANRLYKILTINSNSV